ncbi:amidase [Nocardioides marmoraquaticus]
MAELHDLTALEQGAAIRAGETSTAELVEHYLARIDGEPYGAFVTVTGEAARAARPVGHGPLAGVPTAVKDLAQTVGVRTTFGSPVFAEHVPAVSDEVVLRLERGGLVSLGKTSTPELGSPCYTEPEGRPPAVTPYDTSRMAGGSSGGAAAAVAAGLVPVAHGSDGGGSIRIPASCCGLVGLKPSRGRISGAPVFGDVVGLSSQGSIARTVRDAAALLDVMAGRHVGDPTWAPPAAEAFLAAAERESGRLRVSRFRDPVITDTELDASCVDAYEEVSRRLVALGHDVEDVPGPISRDAVPVFETCWAVLTAQSVLPLPEHARPLLRPLTRWLAERGLAVSGPAFALAVGELRRAAAAALQAVAAYDVVLTPTLASPPLPVGAIRDDADPAADFEAQKRFTPFTSLWNLTGSPAVSLPTHWTPDGLPVGTMLAAAPGEESLLVSLAAQLEASYAADGLAWHEHHPPGW